ncbi:MAG TPA: tetratricopeptide repeat protein [Chloroflexota bacterium]|jgi:tetratricopeptide (TPR) repeat protein
MAEHNSGGPGLEQVGRVEPNGVAHKPEIPMQAVNPNTRGGTPLWLLAAVAVGAVGVTLALVFVGLHLVVATSPAPTATAVAAAPVPTALPAVVAVDRSPVPAASGPTSACATPLADAQSLGQAGRWSDAATRLETVRDQCDVVGPLYDAYLNQGRGLADQERPADAIAMFDKALQVKNGTEASTERALAVAYQDGRTALDSGDFDAAIDKLGRVQVSRPDYGRGNNTLNLINAYLSKGDALLVQSQCADALNLFQRAQALKPNETAIVQRVNSAQQCSRPTVVPAPAIAASGAPPVSAPAAAPPPTNLQPLESTVRAYYDAINSRRFGDAYSILSNSARATQSLASFAGRFTATRSIGLRYIDGTSANGSSAGLNAHTQTVTAGPAGLSTSCSRVVWALIVENGQWKRDIRSESNNEFGEAC